MRDLQVIICYHCVSPAYILVQGSSGPRLQGESGLSAYDPGQSSIIIYSLTIIEGTGIAFISTHFFMMLLSFAVCLIPVQ